MKTLHRYMYENLNEEEYKQFCRVPVEFFDEQHGLGSLSFDYTRTSKSSAATVVALCFRWDIVEEVTGFDFSSVADRLDNRGHYE